MSKDYYKILGIEKSASQDEIKRAYKKLAVKHHPDVNKEAGAEAKFKEIKSLQEYYKQMEKQKKQSDSYSKMENWIKRQAAVMDMEIKLKKRELEEDP